MLVSPKEFEIVLALTEPVLGLGTIELREIKFG
jgi:hypothetical protein